MSSIAHAAPTPRAEAAREMPYAFRVTPTRTIEAFADRCEAETRADELGADGLTIEWLRYPRADDPDDSATLASDPPYAADRIWWQTAAEREQAGDLDWSDYAAWLDRWHHLPWDLYPGEGLWDQDHPCLPERKAVAP